MKLTDQQQLIIQQQHDSYCKTILANEMRKQYREERQFKKHNNLALVLLSDAELKDISTTDEHSIDFVYYTVKGYTVPVKDVRISQALNSLTDRKRDIILLHFYLEINDREIANMMGLAPSTVHHHKTSALELLREILGGQQNNE